MKESKPENRAQPNISLVYRRILLAVLVGSLILVRAPCLFAQNSSQTVTTRKTIDEQSQNSSEPFKRVVPRYSREDNLRVEYATLRFHRNYLAASPAKEEIDVLLKRAGAAYNKGDLDETKAIFQRVRELLVNAPRVVEKRPQVVVPGTTMRSLDALARGIAEFIDKNNLYDPEGKRLRIGRNIPSPRGELRYAIALYKAGGPVNLKRADEIVESIVDSQHRIEGSRFYGSYYFPEYSVYPPEYDQFLLPIFYHLGKYEMSKMSSALQAKLRESFRHVLRGLKENWYVDKEERHHIGHTNYYLMYLEGLMLIGELQNEKDAAEKAYRAFDLWLDYVVKNGITEFNSPTYYGINIRSLENIYRETMNPRAREQARAALDLFYLDMATHYNPHRQWITGANSRSYSVMGGIGAGQGRMIAALSPSELLTLRTDNVDAFPIYAPYRPPDFIREIAGEKRELTFEGRWGPEYGQDRQTHFGRGFVLGTGGSEYGSQDRLMVFEFLNTHKEWPAVVAVLETSDNPYELPKRGGWSGENHDKAGVSSVQNGGRALVLYDLDFKSERVQRSIVALSLLFPAEAEEIRINDQIVTDRTEKRGYQLKAGDVIFVTEGKVTFAFGWVPGSKLTEQEPAYRLKFDGPVPIRELKEQVPMARLMAVMHEGEEQGFDRDDVLTGFTIEVHSGDRESRSEFIRSVLGERSLVVKAYDGRKSVVYQRGENRLGIERDFARNRTLNRWVDFRHYSPRIFNSEIFDLAPDGVLTVKWNGQSHVYDLTPAVTREASSSTKE